MNHSIRILYLFIYLFILNDEEPTSYNSEAFISTAGKANPVMGVCESRIVSKDDKRKILWDGGCCVSEKKL